MDISFSRREFRLLLDLVYSGNWVINSVRGSERFDEYDSLQNKVFSYCRLCGLDELADGGEKTLPSEKYVDGGIHEVILDYEDMVFYGILAEELARRDLKDRDVDGADSELLAKKIDEYMLEFSKNGIDNVAVNGI
jgi:hypothetical protein